MVYIKMDMIKSLKERWKGYKEKRFLENYGCETWREYELKYDPDIGFRARWAHTFYHGYPHLIPIDPQGLCDYGFHGVHHYHDLVEKMIEWCEQNCQGKWRNDWHRGFWDHQGNYEVYELNGIGGGDIMFFAFKEESDYIWFKLTWQ
jgi:hypothetical protein